MSFPHQACEVIQSKIGELKPKLGIILGSGLSAIAKTIRDPITLDYKELPGFPETKVEGHSGCLIIGNLNGATVACLQGRMHRYEQGHVNELKNMIRTLKLLGVQDLLITNAAGSLREDVPPGELMLIIDHINFSFDNPLIGPNEAEFGERFVSMEDAYSPRLRNMILTTAKHLGIKLAQGIYVGVSGPAFETPAEIRAFRFLGGDAVGMSTVPDVIIARHCGLNVAVISAITNFAAGMKKAGKLSHEETLKFGSLTAPKLEKLILAYAGSLRDADE
ncbi:MAG: purine-nucleoside phosphorylase [Legionellales bacterium]|nr:purine-nucleoside phosphorylase [Legionellales bacterium]